MSLPCTRVVADNALSFHAPLLQRAGSDSTRGQLPVRKGLGASGPHRGGYARQHSVVVVSSVPLSMLSVRTLWIKEVGFRSLLPVASIHARFGRTVRALRAKAGYSQESFADAIHIHRTSMGMLERGDGNPTLETLVKIARGLDVSLSELFLAVERDTG